MIKRFFFFCFLTFAVICVSAQDYRDVVFLKNGSVIKGFYRELYPSDTLRMETIDGGIFVCAMSDVVRIAKERTSLYVVNIQDEASMPMMHTSMTMYLYRAAVATHGRIGANT